MLRGARRRARLSSFCFDQMQPYENSRQEGILRPSGAAVGGFSFGCGIDTYHSAKRHGRTRPEGILRFRRGLRPSLT